VLTSLGLLDIPGICFFHHIVTTSYHTVAAMTLDITVAFVIPLDALLT
jgi:hypothetical protein